MPRYLYGHPIFPSHLMFYPSEADSSIAYHSPVYPNSIHQNVSHYPEQCLSHLPHVPYHDSFLVAGQSCHAPPPPEVSFHFDYMNNRSASSLNVPIEQEQTPHPKRTTSNMPILTSSSQPHDDQSWPPSSDLVLSNPNLDDIDHQFRHTSSTKRREYKKMHECLVCHKMFPRPSGLRTHMNTHDHVRPYKCLVDGCDKSFTVKSNCKRHMRTHGISLEESSRRFEEHATLRANSKDDNLNILAHPSSSEQQHPAPPSLLLLDEQELQWYPPQSPLPPPPPPQNTKSHHHSLRAGGEWENTYGYCLDGFMNSPGSASGEDWQVPVNYHHLGSMWAANGQTFQVHDSGFNAVTNSAFITPRLI